MKVTIESSVGGSVAGYIQCTVRGNESISSLILNYCESKGVPVNSAFVLRDQKGVILDNRKLIADCSIKDGDVLYLESGEKPDTIFNFMNWWLVAGGALFVAVGGFVTILCLHLLLGPTPIKFGVVLDGGSTHTGLYVYQWDGPKWMGTGVLKQVGACTAKGDIVSLYNNFTALDSFLTPCLTYASDQVPSNSRAYTPIFFGATAGFRLLNISEPSAANVLLGAIRNRLGRSGFQFDPSYVEILSGKEEAQFSWVTVNTQLHSLGPNSSVIIWGTETSETVGALDLGGASTQIAFQLPAGHTISPELSDQGSQIWREDNLSVLELYGRNYSVYSSSSLCYGALEVTKRYHSMLVAGLNGSETVVDSPCHPIGYKDLVRAKYIFSSPCAENRTEDWKFDEWTVNGTSDYLRCSALVERLFDPTDCQSHFLPSTCFTNHTQPPVANQSFVAFSTFNVIAMEMNATNNTTLKEFRNSIQRVCNMTWEQLIHVPTPNNSSFLPLLCLESQYVLSLLTSGYGFDDNSWKSIRFVAKISNEDVGWSMGYMTERTNHIAAAEATVFLGTAAFATLAVLFCLILAVGLNLSYHAARMKRSANSYSRLRHHTYGSLNLSL